MGWKYKGTKQPVKVGDTVALSKRWAKEYGQYATVTALHGFITVLLSDGSKVDFDARNLTFVRSPS